MPNTAEKVVMHQQASCFLLQDGCATLSNILNDYMIY